MLYEIYIIDLIADGSGDRTVQEGVKKEMKIDVEMFKKVEDQLSNRVAKQRDV